MRYTVLALLVAALSGCEPQQPIEDPALSVDADDKIPPGYLNRLTEAQKIKYANGLYGHHYSAVSHSDGTLEIEYASGKKIQIRLNRPFLERGEGMWRAFINPNGPAREVIAINPSSLKEEITQESFERFTKAAEKVSEAYWDARRILNKEQKIDWERVAEFELIYWEEMHEELPAIWRERR